MSPSRGPGKGRGLTFGSRSADNGVVDSTRASIGLRANERGQAMVEFALIAPLFLLIVVGVIQFGIALNYWLDLNRIANQGARWAVVDKWPDCPSDPGCTLQEHLVAQALTEGLKPTVEICFPQSADGAVGEPLRVRAVHNYRFNLIVNQVGFQLKGEATMRIEQPPAKLNDVANNVNQCLTS